MVKQKQFLKDMDDSDIWWELELARAYGSVTVRVINYKKTAQGIPIILYVQEPGSRSYEIPWTAIQTIRPAQTGEYHDIGE